MVLYQIYFKKLARQAGVLCANTGRRLVHDDHGGDRVRAVRGRVPPAARQDLLQQACDAGRDGRHLGAECGRQFAQLPAQFGAAQRRRQGRVFHADTG